MSHWNFRLVDMTEENGNEPYIELREVHYNDEGIPMGHTSACMGADTLDGIKEVMQWHTLALGKPILYESDFVGKYEDDKDNGAWHEDNDWDTRELFK